MENYHVGKVIKRISILIEKNINKMLAEKDLSSTQGFVLLFLSKCKNQTSTIKEIEKEFDTAQSTVFGIVTRLEKKGFVTSFVDENRIKFVVITKDGLELSDYIEKSIKTCEKNVFSCLTSTEQSIFIELLKKFEQNTQ